MGTQQILLIVLSIIVVGAAIAVGIETFNSQAYSSNKSALASNSQIFGTMIIQYYKTPRSLGGAGQNLMRNASTSQEAAKEIGRYIGWSLDNEYHGNDDHEVRNDDGIFTISVDNDNETVIITAIGIEVRRDKTPKVVSTIKFPEGQIMAKVSDNDVQ